MEKLTQPNSNLNSSRSSHSSSIVAKRNKCVAMLTQGLQSNSHKYATDNMQ